MAFDPGTERSSAFHVIDSAGPRGGNILLRCGTDFVIKLYRRRGSRFSDLLRSLGAAIFEGRRGTTAVRRYETEKLSLRLWRSAGFDVLRSFPFPLPGDLAPPGIWFEYCPASTLSAFLELPTVPVEAKLQAVERLGRELRKRHEVALREAEPLFVQEHATTNHVFLHGERWIHFDLENGFAPGYPVIGAMAYELSSYLRAVAKRCESFLESSLRAFIRGYDDSALLRRALLVVVRSPQLTHRLRRFSDQRKRKLHGKTALSRKVLELLR